MATSHRPFKIFWNENFKHIVFVNNDPIVFLDMDGVLADFFGAFSNFAKVKHWKDLGPSELMQTMDAIIGSDFFGTIPKTWCCDEFISMVTGFSGSYSILSSPLEGDEENCAYWKKVWIQNNLNPGPSDIFIDRDKGKYALYQNKSNILIDDRPHNIKAWENEGGIAIRFQANQDQLGVIEEVFKSIKKNRLNGVN